MLNKPELPIFRSISAFHRQLILLFVLWMFLYPQFSHTEELTNNPVDEFLFTTPFTPPMAPSPYEALPMESPNQIRLRDHDLPGSIIYGQDIKNRPETRLSLAPELKEELSETELKLPFGLKHTQYEPLLAWLQYFRNKGRTTYSRYLARSGKYRGLIEKILVNEGLPREVIYLSMLESGFKPTARSRANAVGLWQFTSGTGTEYGLTINRYVDERRDPFKATHAAAVYLKSLYKQFNNWPLVFAAYNCGRYAVIRSILKYNTNNFWKMFYYDGLPKATRSYVAKILAAGIVGENPEFFEFDGVQFNPAWAFDIVDVEGGIRLALLARAARCSVEELQELNPELLKFLTPPDQMIYPLRIPEGSTKQFVENYDRFKKKYGKEHTVIVLRFGETVSMAAVQSGLPNRILKYANNLKKDRIPYGTELIIPTKNLKKKEGSENQRRTTCCNCP